ncbi:uncharacterized protein EDB91DRAFT_1249131 [Suillus paluster]|uniref:uncharacterized protein n=1 Tax=Suillus paluster TaxID=48578 RepID=UPI001B86A597|nr:uncharacterized protein EDB91DRAFT_1249131 [Suillus paluster]KAG1738608.1 hypothetical protein EDB91DRAFT_1249131 [Suillus paluster]
MIYGYEPVPICQDLLSPLSSEGTWEKLSQVAVKGAEYDSPERQPHPKCLEGTRVELLNSIHGLLDNQEKSQLIWLHGTAGVGKSAVAFTVAERMKMRDQTNNERRLAGTFFFSRKHTKCCTTGSFFATLVYQLARNFPSIREDVNKSIRENPALLDPNKSLRDKMEAFFLQPLRRLQFRLRGCPPLSFVVDALDECTSESELADLISLLGQALREPDLPVTHVLLTSRSEEHICKAIRREEMRPLVCEIPVDTSGKGVAATISVDGADVDNDIYIFLEHSFRQLQRHHPGFPQPPRNQLARLASRASRLFIVASTMMKFIDDGYHDPRDRLQLMLELASELLPGTEVYKLYDSILSTCADPKWAYLHLSVVAALADPLSISQISQLLGPYQGRDVETTLVTLRSVMNIPTDNRFPVVIYHSSVRDYVSDPSNCSLPQVQRITSPHTLLAHSSFRLMMQDISESTALLDALLELKRQSRFMKPHGPQSLRQSLAFVVQPPEPLQALVGLLWLRGDRSLDVQPWLETLGGRAWLQTPSGKEWLRTHSGEDWLHTKVGLDWLQTQEGLDWLRTQGGRHWLQTQGGQDWLPTQDGQDWLQIQDGRDWLQTQAGCDWLQAQDGQDWLQVQGGRDWLQTQGGRVWLQTLSGRDWLQAPPGRDWLQTPPGRVWLQTQGGRLWMQTQDGQTWLQTWSGREWLQTQSGREWLQTQSGQEWMQSWSGREWLQSEAGRTWLQSQVRPTQLQTQARRTWLQTQYAEACWSNQFKDVQWRGEHDWLRSQGGREWLKSEDGQSWLQMHHDQAWQSTPAMSVWMTMEEFSSMLEAVSEYIIIPESPLPPAFQVIQQFKSLPDFLMLPAFLALRSQDHSTSVFPRDRFLPDVEIVHAMASFAMVANETRERTQSASDALKYACQNWAFHLSRAPSPWDDRLNRAFKLFWDRHLLSWLERQWCLKGLRSCLIALSEGQKLAKSMSQNPSPLSSEGTLEKLSQVAVKGAEYDSPERQPHPKCLEGTRVDVLDCIHGLFDSRESQMIWLHGMAGVGKSAVAFTVAERMKALRMADETNHERRLAGTFFFSRKHTKRCTTGYFFATLAYQLASNFPVIQEDLNRAIRQNPALLGPDKSLREQMDALFLQPLWRLRYRLRKSLVFVIDALDECTSETELADLISLLGQALRKPDLPVIHILLTSHLKAHIREAIQKLDAQLVHEIPATTYRDGTIISLDGPDVDHDIYVFLEYSFTQLQRRHPDFLQLPRDQLMRLVSRAGRRFIVASTMIKFIDDGYRDPRDRLELILELTCDFLPGTEVYKLYDRILSTCVVPERAYLHLSIVAALADPLSIPQISKLLGPGQGSDVEPTLMQLRSIMDIPTDSHLPVNICHSSVRDYASDASNCGLPGVQNLTAHSLLAEHSLRLMIRDIPGCTTLLDALSELKKQSKAMQPDDPQSLKQSLAFVVQHPEPLQVLIGLLWLRGDRGPDLQFWLETLDGRAWLKTQRGKDWLQTQCGEDWLHTKDGLDWLQTQDGLDWLQTQGGRHWLQTQGGRNWLPTQEGKDWLQTQDGRFWLQTQDGREWLRDGFDWLQTQGGRDWLQAQGGQEWLQLQGGREWLTQAGGEWLQTQAGRVWLHSHGGRGWLQSQDGTTWLQSYDGREWLQSQGGREWLQTPSGGEWLQSQSGLEWLQSQPGRMWLQTQARPTQLQTQARRTWLRDQMAEASRLFLIAEASRLHQLSDIRLQGEPNWLRSQGGKEWLQTEAGHSWLQTQDGRDWQSTAAASVWATMEEFSSTFGAIREYTIIPGLHMLPAFQVIQLFRTLPDFLMFPVFLASRPQDHSTSASTQICLPPDVEILRAMTAFVAFAQEAQERSRSTSSALSYACQNWAFHLSRAPHPWDDGFNHIFKVFWNGRLLSWLERLWCLKGLHSCLAVLSEGQKLAQVCMFAMVFTTQHLTSAYRHNSKLHNHLSHESGAVDCMQHVILIDIGLFPTRCLSVYSTHALSDVRIEVEEAPIQSEAHRRLYPSLASRHHPPFLATAHTSTSTTEPYHHSSPARLPPSPPHPAATPHPAAWRYHSPTPIHTHTIVHLHCHSLEFTHDLVVI